MQSLLISLIQEKEGCYFTLQGKVAGKKIHTGHKPGQRISPIYSVSESEIEPDFLTGTRTIDLFYSEKPYSLIKQALILNKDYNASLYTSHGYAALICFDLSETQRSRFREDLKGFSFANENFATLNGKIVGQDSLAPTPESTLNLRNGDYPLLSNLHESLDCSSFSNLEFIIFKASQEARPLPSQLGETLNYYYEFCLQSSIDLLLLNCRLTDAQYLDKCTLPAPLNSARLNELKEKRSNDSLRIDIESHIRDESVQIFAILQSIIYQGLSGLPPMVYGISQPSPYSLFGIGTGYTAITVLYNNVFKRLSPYFPESILQTLASISAPRPFRQVVGYEKFLVDELQPLSRNIQKLLPEAPNGRQLHLLYFSNRLGFRATKLSITAALQSIELGILPSWNLTTMFHEFMHIIAIPLLSELYPSSKTTFGKTFKLYSEYWKEGGNPRPEHLSDYISFVMLDCACRLSAESTQFGEQIKTEWRGLSEAGAIQALARQKHTIEEVIVHVLDYNYFYPKSDKHDYVCSIWASWTALPVTHKRIQDYLFRSLAALASDHIAEPGERFETALHKLKLGLRCIIDNNVAEPSLIQKALDSLSDDTDYRRIRGMFLASLTLIDATYHFFVVENIKADIRAEISESQDDDGNFTLKFPINSYDQDEIESPIDFIFKLLLQYTHSPPENCIDETIKTTNWMFQTIASTKDYNE